MTKNWDYSEQIADRILDELADGKSLVKICLASDMPSRRTVLRWMRDDAEFGAKCARAREEGQEYHVDRMSDLEEDVINGRLDPQAARVVLASMQWKASKIAPKKYGEKLELEHSGSVAQVLPSLPTADEWAARHAEDSETAH